MTNLTPETIARLRELHSKATPGPWFCVNVAGNAVLAFQEPTYDAMSVLGGINDSDTLTDDECLLNGTMVAETRNALPALLDAAEENAKLRALLKPYEYDEQKTGDIPFGASWFYCKHCKRDVDQGHKPDCEWKAVMR